MTTASIMLAAYFVAAIVLLAVAMRSSLAALLGLLPTLWIGLVALAEWRGSPWGMVAAQSFLPVGLLLVYLGRPQPDETDPGRHMAVVLFFLLILVAVLFIVGPAFVHGVTVAYALFFTVVMVALLVRLGLMSRKALAADFAGEVATIMEQRLPLEWGLRAAAAGRSGRRASNFERVARHLEEGEPLSIALQKGYIRCPGYLLGTVAAAQRSGRLPQAMRDLAERLTRRARPKQAGAGAHMGYAVLLTFIMLLLVNMVMVFILPKFVAVFGSLGANLPAPTAWLLNAADGGRHLYVALLVTALIAVPITLRVYARTRRPARPRLLSRAGDFLTWHLLGGRWWLKNRCVADAAEAIRNCLLSGETIDRGVAAAADLDLNGCYRRRLRRWHGRIIGGQDVSVAARAARVGRPLAWAFDAEANPANAPDALDLVARLCRGVNSVRRQVLAAAIAPLTTILLGLMVGFIVFAVFLPLVHIVRVACEGVYP
jgi:type II secretory pathway component PulF